MKIVVISGPTAAGKTATAIAVAAAIDGEIVNADSLQVYRHLDVGTAKPTKEEQAVVPHHLIDVVDPDEPYSAARYQKEADEVIAGLDERQKVPLMVGGTGLYIRSLLYGLCSIPDIPPVIRQEVRQQLEKDGVEVLHDRLRRVDPQTADQLTPRDQSRVSRALEVFLATGTSIRRFQGQHRFARPRYRFLHLFLHCDRELLYERINQRVQTMMAAGFLDEVKRLLAMGFPPSLKPLQSIGYRQLILHCQGEISLDEAVRQTARDTRHYAKRQYTWFAREAGVTMVDEAERDRIPRLIEMFLKE